MLDFQVFFNEIATVASGRPGLPGNGDLNIEVRDSTGDLIGAGTALMNSGGVTIGERIATPVVRNETYYLRVFGATGAAVNGYNMTVINLPAPVPQTIDLRSRLRQWTQRHRRHHQRHHADIRHHSR